MIVTEQMQEAMNQVAAQLLSHAVRTRAPAGHVEGDHHVAQYCPRADSFRRLSRGKAEHVRRLILLPPDAVQVPNEAIVHQENGQLHPRQAQLA